MKNKDHLKDYATEAFRFYKSVGGLEAYKKKIQDEILLNRQNSTIKSSGISKPVEAAILRSEQVLDDKISEIADLEAVERTFYIIKKTDGGEAVKRAVEIVYFTDYDKKIEKGDIQERVIKASIYIPADVRTVYRYLKKARIIFAVERGLRI